MKRALIAALAVAPLLAAPAIVYAKETPTAAQPAKPATKSDADFARMMKLSDDGFNAVRGIRTARIAIFNGDPQAAEKSVGSATDAMTKAEKDAVNFYGRTNASNDGQYWIPVDATLDVADNFVDTPEKQQHVKKANEHFQSGDKNKAVEELKLAEIDVNFTRLLMPLTTTQDHIQAATKLLDQKKYYEANLALKAAEDGLVVDTVALTDIPKPQQNGQAQKSADASSSSTASSSTTGKPATTSKQ